MINTESTAAVTKVHPANRPVRAPGVNKSETGQVGGFVLMHQALPMPQGLTRHSGPKRTVGPYCPDMGQPQNPPHATDRPALTRAWIIASFNRLVLGRRYESLSVGEVTRRAGVGRSTFYEHFRDKDDVLRQALEVVLAPLADAAIGRGNTSRVLAVLNHVAENRERSIAMLDGPARAQVEQALAQLILARLNEGTPQAQSTTHRLNASRLAGSHVAVLQTWLKEPDWPALVTQVASVLVDPSPSVASTRTDALRPLPIAPAASG